MRWASAWVRRTLISAECFDIYSSSQENAKHVYARKALSQWLRINHPHFELDNAQSSNLIGSSKYSRIKTGLYAGSLGQESVPAYWLS
jgi:hypothetical protein